MTELMQTDLGLHCPLTESVDTVVYVDKQRMSRSGPGCSKLVKGHFVSSFSRFNTQFSDIFC